MEFGSTKNLIKYFDYSFVWENKKFSVGRKFCQVAIFGCQHRDPVREKSGSGPLIRLILRRRVHGYTRRGGSKNNRPVKITKWTHNPLNLKDHGYTGTLYMRFFPAAYGGRKNS